MAFSCNRKNRGPRKVGSSKSGVKTARLQAVSRLERDFSGRGCEAAQAKSRTKFSWMKKIYARDFDLLRKYAAAKWCVAAQDRSRTNFRLKYFICAPAKNLILKNQNWLKYEHCDNVFDRVKTD